MPKTVYRTCTLCEAMCGLAFEVEGDRITSVGPDHDDVFSQGYICPKGAAIASIHNDPDRLRQPLRRTAPGKFEPISWEDAFEIVGQRLGAIRRRDGADAIALYIGNPAVHNHGALLLRSALFKAVGSRNCTGAGSQDTSTRFAASYYLYGASLSVPIPDLDRTDYLLCLGANPRVSNGSLLTAPNIRRRLQEIRQRGGKIVVVDPRRTETARDADEHIAILPGGDAALLLSMVQVIVAEGHADLAGIQREAIGWQEIERRLPKFTPERVASQVGIPAETIRRLAHDFRSAASPVAYSRVGVCNNRYGTIASYATDLLNLVTGRLGAIGGSMFPEPPFDATPIVKLTKADGHARFHSRVRKLPETLGDLPASMLAEEIETPGRGQVKGFITYAGNPVLSTPNGRRLDAALGQLEFMVSIDIYLNETTRHADIILPPAWSLSEDHMDLMATNAAVRHIARWSPPVLPVPAGQKTDRDILLELIYRLGGGPTGFKPVDWFYRAARHVGFHWSPDSSVDLLLRIGPHGDKFLPWKPGLNLKKLKQEPHGVDLGPLNPGVKHRLVHRDGKIHLAAEPIVQAIDQLAHSLDEPLPAGSFLMIGRRELRSNNSWMHNVPELMSGQARCVLLMNPHDAAQAGIADGGLAIVENHIHRGEVRVRTSDEMRPGVVSLPHGYGHAASAPWQATAGAHAGVSANDWSDDQDVESVVGQSILNGVRVKVFAKSPVASTDAPAAASAV
jgi:anaerobic selenocysteine-containing dehydrogenase